MKTRIAVVGAGAMGRGIVSVLRKIEDMKVVALADTNSNAIEATRPFLPGDALVTADSMEVLDRNPDVLVDATGCVLESVLLAIRAIKQKTHIVLTNSSVDQSFGRLLAMKAEANGVILTSDAGDQPGVLVRLADEICHMGFQLVMAGNNKGFLDRYANPETIREEAAKRRLSVAQCTAFTDGTKLAMEMALAANALGLGLLRTGMIGPAVTNVEQALDAFDLGRARELGGVVDYVLGARPGGSVFVIGYSDDEEDRFYMDYYKMGRGPYYLFMRPYHLCHFETQWTIRQIVEYGRPVLVQKRRVLEVGCRAKTDLRVGTRLEGIGGHHVYGILEEPGNLPIGMVENTVLLKPKSRDEIITWDDVRFPSGDQRLAFWKDQIALEA